uniref:Carboxylesterase type B domain-containing protein n=1 Tax=Phlebotomus papatasi TaxID=29031 RepID=A0A1B0DAJ9_PHLPP
YEILLIENISSFGGDPSSVTLAGHGTGAACVHFLISSSAVPEASSTKLGDKGPMKYPVMVFVHGESYEWNSGNPYEGAVLASFGQILVVTINYRLGILGFLNANTNRYVKSPANYGLMDIIAALHWIQVCINSNLSTF